MSYDSSNLTTPDIKWLGVRPSDLDRFNIPQQCRLPMTDEDIKTGKRLVGPPFMTPDGLTCVIELLSDVLSRNHHAMIPACLDRLPCSMALT